MNERLKSYLESLPSDLDIRRIEDAIRSRKIILIGGIQGPTGKTTLCSILREEGVSALEEKDVYRIRLDQLL